MRVICLLIVFATVSAKANTWYVSSRYGDDSRSSADAQHSRTPWKTLNKLNTILPNLRPGDSVLFQRGDIFNGYIRIPVSGTATQPIVFAAYGTGSMPVISGFSKLTTWTSAGKGIWQSSCPDCGPTVNMLTIAGQPSPMGRTPNADEPDGGYLPITSHVKNISITNDNLGKGPDWTGAELIIRKNRFIIDRSTIISQSGNTITCKGGSFYESTDKFGFFIQNDLRTLDRNGEWYYDIRAKTMSLYFGNENPTGKDILASSVETLVVIKDQNYIVVKGLAFQGSNLDAINLSGTTGVSITDCSISASGLNAIRAVKAVNTTVADVTIRNSNNNGIDMNGTGNKVQDNKVARTGTIPGMGTGETSYIGINSRGTGNTVQYNQVDTTGYVPIFFMGSDNTIRNNVVRYFAFMKDDGGGIYTWSGDIDTTVQRNTGIIIGNIVLDGITAPAGTDRKQEGIAYGIYLDENSGRIEVNGNTVSRCTGGIFLQDAHEVTVKGNTVYDNGFQLSLRHPLVKGTVRNNSFRDNIAVAKKGDQSVLVLSSAVSGDVSGYAEFDGNKYAQLSTGQGSFYKVVTKPQGGSQTQTKGSLDQWKKGFGKDNSSSAAAPAGTPVFEYNATKSPRSVPINGAYSDLSGQTYQGTVRLAPFTSVLLFPTNGAGR